MNYLTFVLKDPETKEVKVAGVKYKKTEFTKIDFEKILKNGNSNLEVRIWLRDLKKENKTPILEIIYTGESSVEACHKKQEVLIKSSRENKELIGMDLKPKRYTKKVRANDTMRRAIKDQFGNKYSGVLEAAEQLLLAPSNISKVLHGKLEHIGGFIFSFDLD